MPMTSSGEMWRRSSGSSRYWNFPTSMLFFKSMTAPIVSGSMPRTMTPARFDGDDIMTSPETTGVAPTTPGVARTRSSTLP